MSRIYLSFILVMSILYVGCDEPLDTMSNNENGPREYARNVKMEYRDSVTLQVSITAPLLERLVEDKTPITVFNEGVHVQFFDSHGNIQSWLTADKAKQYPKKGEIIASENVFLYNVMGDTLITSEIIWDESKSEVRTSKFVKIKRPNNEVINSYGFRADQKFTNFTLYAIEGNVQVKDLDLQ